MKIEIFDITDIHEECYGGTMFHAEDLVRDAISNLIGFQGIVLIDNIPVKFSFSCMGMDGDIFTNDPVHRTIVKNVVPMYAYYQKKLGRYGGE